MVDDLDFFEQVYEKPGARWTKKVPHPLLVELVESGIVSVGRALDVGCGEGFKAIYLAQLGFDVVGIDWSKKAISFAQNNAREAAVQVDFRVGDARALKDLDAGFDFVLEWMVFHHIPPEDRPDYLKDISLLMKSGAKYLSVCFAVESPSFGGGGEKIRKSPIGTTLYHSSLDDLAKLHQPYFKSLDSRLIELEGSEGQHHVCCFNVLEKLG